MDSDEHDESNSVLYKVMVNRKIVEKVQMNMNTLEYEGQLPNHPQQQELEHLRKINKALESKYNETFAALDDVRRNALEASERALDREFRIAILEKALHGCELALKEAQTKQEATEAKLLKQKTDYKREMGILDLQVEQFKNLCKERDQRIINLVNSSVKMSSQIKELKNRETELSNALQESNEKLNALITESTEREQMLNNLESQLRQRDSQRQALYLKEISKRQRAQIAIQARQKQTNQILACKDTTISELKAQVSTLASKLQRITTIFNQVNESTSTSKTRVGIVPTRSIVLVVPNKNKPPEIEYVINNPVAQVTTSN